MNVVVQEDFSMTAFHSSYSKLSVRLDRAFLLIACFVGCCASDLQLNAQIMTQGDLQKEITVYESSSRSAEPPKMPAVQAARIWLRLGILYQDAGRYSQSEIAYEHAMRLLTIDPISQPDLAAAIDNLGTLYMEAGNLKDAEQAELKALNIRDKAGLKSELPKSWYHLATLYLRERHPAKAREFAQRANDAFASGINVVPEDKIGNLIVLAASLCQSHRYPEAISQLQTVLRLATNIYGPDQFPTGMSAFLLGYAYWKNGDPASAGEFMQHGSEILDKKLGWHPAYLLILTQYARFLRDAHKPDMAKAIEHEIKQKRTKLNADPTYNRELQTIDIAALF